MEFMQTWGLGRVSCLFEIGRSDGRGLSSCELQVSLLWQVVVVGGEAIGM